jgi:hypothetical protein
MKRHIRNSFIKTMKPFQLTSLITSLFVLKKKKRIDEETQYIIIKIAFRLLTKCNLGHIYLLFLI